MVHQVVGRINGAYGTLTHLPIHHLDKQLPFHELCALYAVTDVALVTSLRDGMNLVSYEYVACQRDNAGEHLQASLSMLELLQSISTFHGTSRQCVGMTTSFADALTASAKGVTASAVPRG